MPHPLADGLAYGCPAGATWSRLSDHPLLVVVGQTGVGKSGVLARAREIAAFVELPNRRLLTDRLIIAPEVSDPAAIASLGRSARMRITQRFREHQPGGMAALLVDLYVRHGEGAAPYVFDGLRGVEEVGFALDVMPRRTAFVVLTAPPAVRLKRLCQRRDPFDDRGRRMSPTAPPAEVDEIVPLLETCRIEIPDPMALAGALADSRLPASGIVARIDTLEADLAHYDPNATLELLQTRAPERLLCLDTFKSSIDDSAARFADFVATQTGDG